MKNRTPRQPKVTNPNKPIKPKAKNPPVARGNTVPKPYRRKMSKGQYIKKGDRKSGAGYSGSYN